MDLAQKFLRVFNDGWEPVKRPAKSASVGHYCTVRAKNGTILQHHWEPTSSSEQCPYCQPAGAINP